MGLALHNASDFSPDSLAESESQDSQPSLSDSALFLSLYLPPSPPDFNPRSKHPYRPFQWSQRKLFNRHEGVVFHTSTIPEQTVHPWFRPPPPRPHHIALYNANLAKNRNPAPVDPWRTSLDQASRDALSASRKACSKGDLEEAEALARCDDVMLPGEWRARGRVPSLERQDAFCDGRTVKRKRSPDCLPVSGGVSEFYREAAAVAAMAAAAAADDEEELYRMGLLYDDEHERGEGFSLGLIEHEEPLWNVSLRPAKRRGRGRTARRGQLWTQTPGGDEGARYALDLALSFAALGDDEAVAKFLMAPGEEEMVVDEVERDIGAEGRKTESKLVVVHGSDMSAEDRPVEQRAHTYTDPHMAHATSDSIERMESRATPRMPSRASLQEAIKQRRERRARMWERLASLCEQQEREDGWDFLERNLVYSDSDEEDFGDDSNGTDMVAAVDANTDADTWVVLGCDGS